MNVSAMKCGIHNCTQGDNRFLWHCRGTCGRFFHAACIGAQRNNEDVLRTFMLPLCHDCQTQFTTELNLKALTVSLRQIESSIEKTLESNHKLISNYSSLSAGHDEAMDSIEKSLHELTGRIKHLETISRNNAADMRNAVSSLSDTPPANTPIAIESVAKTAAIAAVAEMSTKTTTAAFDPATFESAAKSAATAAIQTAAAAATTTTTDSISKILSSFKNDLVDSNAILASEVKSHMEELAKSLHTPAVTTTTPTIHPNVHHSAEPMPSWRFLGSKKVWKRDWAEYDARQNRRRLQEKNQEKARRRQKQRKHQHEGRQQNAYSNNCNNNNNNNHNDVSTNNNYNDIDKNNNCNTNSLRTSPPSHAPLPLDKELLAAARLNFSGPPLTTDHPIAGLTAKFVNFRQGETIHPIMAKNHTPLYENAADGDKQEEQPTTHNTNDPPPPLLDPMRPPVVRLTEQSTTGDRRYLKARLRDQKIRDTARTFLSYLHDQPPNVCIRGITRTSASVMLAAEGLPTDTNLLREIFLDVHEELGISRCDALADLEAHRAFISSERTQRLQQAREASQKFYSPLNFQRR